MIQGLEVVCNEPRTLIIIHILHVTSIDNSYQEVTCENIVHWSKFNESMHQF
jgi:hypothetical protein